MPIYCLIQHSLLKERQQRKDKNSEIWKDIVWWFPTPSPTKCFCFFFPFNQSQLAITAVNSQGTHNKFSSRELSLLIFQRNQDVWMSVLISILPCPGYSLMSIQKFMSCKILRLRLSSYYKCTFWPKVKGS